jgi:hypothetical protein
MKINIKTRKDDFTVRKNAKIGLKEKQLQAVEHKIATNKKASNGHFPPLFFFFFSSQTQS